ncbi:MAG TPA: TauD/TfdA family dioxygenase [Aquihabitans sp.]|nr:TauD/TfdA family dioxygenase [Aquihabitans sp.]
MTTALAPHRPEPAGPRRAHAAVPARHVAGPWDRLRALPARLGPGTTVDDATVAAVAAEPLLPATTRGALARFRADPGPAGALLLRGLPLGAVPATPPHPTAPSGKDLVSELLLLAVALELGEPVGYRPEHGGALVQNLLPVRATAATQTSTSSSVDLEFHTETAFHPHRPHHLLLSCLRGDARAQTHLCSIRELLDDLGEPTRRTLAEPRFRTRVDESFGGTPDQEPGPAAPVLRGDLRRPTLVFDAELMTAVDPEAADALDALRALATARRTSLVLVPGDLLVVDNHTCIHGRSAFAARYDGTDRWLQRSFVVDDLTPSAAERDGRIIDTVRG